MTDRSEAERAALARHYSRSPEGPRLERSRVRRLEFRTTMHLLESVLPRRASILELGSGHGAYALALARQGHDVLATDLLEPHVAAIRSRVRDGGIDNVACQVLDAADLHELSAAAFDAVLCLGPFYHLRGPTARRRCLEECRRVVAPEGVVAVSYVNVRLAAAYLAASGAPVSDAQFDALGSDDVRTNYPDDFFDVTHFATPEQVEVELRSAGLEVLAHAATDGVFGFFPHLVEEVDEDAFAAYVAFHLRTCREPSAPAASGHNLVLARRLGPG